MWLQNCIDFIDTKYFFCLNQLIIIILLFVYVYINRDIGEEKGPNAAIFTSYSSQLYLNLRNAPSIPYLIVLSQDFLILIDCFIG